MLLWWYDLIRVDKIFQYAFTIKTEIFPAFQRKHIFLLWFEIAHVLFLLITPNNNMFLCWNGNLQSWRRVIFWMKEKDVHSKLYVRAAIKKNPLKPVLSFKSDARLRSKAHPGNQAQASRAQAQWGQNQYCTTETRFWYREPKLRSNFWIRADFYKL